MDTSCHIEIDRIDSGYLFRVAGTGTLRESPAVRDFVCGAIEDGVFVVMDLSACERLDSTFLGCLVVLHRRGERHGGSFRLYADAETRQRLFGSSKLDQLLSFVESTPESRGTPVALRVTPLERKEFGTHLLECHRRLAELGGPSAETFRRIVDQLQKELGEVQL